MTQRQGATRVGGEVDLLASDLLSIPSSSHLDPAPKHPLRLTPSSSRSQEGSVLITRRRRRQEELDRGSDITSNGDSYNGKGKTNYDRSKLTALDKLEGWFGISNGESSSSHFNSTLVNGTESTPQTAKPPKPRTSRTTQLVIVHTVAPTDSLDSLALRFKTDVRSLRKANGLWPGDSVLVRKELYIPVDEDTAESYGGIHQADEGLGGKLMLLNNQIGTSNGKLHSRPLSNASASSASAASHSYTGQPPVPSPEVRRVPSEALSYFPPPGSSTAGKGKERQDDVFGFGEGMRPGQDVDHGESGVDDLLQLAEKARSRGSSPPIQEIEAAKSSEREAMAGQEEVGSGSPSSSTRVLEDQWKPNKWTFGQKKVTKQSSLAPSDSPAHSSASLPDVTTRGPAMMAISSYQGWNDIPEPPLHRTAKGEVAHAFKGSSRGRQYPRPGGMADHTSSNALIEDLAAGLPANSGPASKWARPIAECLPLPGGDGSSSSSHSTRRGRLPPQSQANVGWGQILSDTVRGKIGLDEALERGLEDIRIMAGSSNAHTINSVAGRRALIQQAGATTSSSQRPSAELARVILSESQIPQPGETSLAISNRLDERSGGRSMHELEDLTVVDERRSDWSSTWAPAGLRDGSSQANNSNVRGRKNVRNVDWLG